jgi:hypothetical protein
MARLTEPRTRALRQVAEGLVYRSTAAPGPANYRIEGFWQPLPQQPLRWLVDTGLATVLEGGSKRAVVITDAGRQQLTPS